MKLTKSDFKNLIYQVSKITGINSIYIEKDLYICLLLKELSNDKTLEHIVFRGGTSLSKCWNVIDRFSEDIDFSIIYPIGESKRRSFKYHLKEICDNLNLKIINYDSVRSRTLMQRFEILYPSIFENNNSIIYLEMSNFSISLFKEPKSIQSYIGKYIDDSGVNSSDFGLEKFKVVTQSLEKTFADKVFALCDYALEGRFIKGSRHIYDLYKIYPLVKNNKELKNIIAITRFDRMKREKRPSAYADCDVNKVLKEIVKTKCFEKDYDTKTKLLLGETIEYNEAINVINLLIKDNLFEFNKDFNPINYLEEIHYIDSQNKKEMDLFINYYNKPLYVKEPGTSKSLTEKCESKLKLVQPSKSSTDATECPNQDDHDDH